MARTIFSVRRRTFLCVTLLVVVLAITLAFVTAQEEAQEAEVPVVEVAEAPAVPVEDVTEAPAAAVEAEPEQQQEQPAATTEEEPAEDAEAMAAAQRQQEEAEVAERLRLEEEARLRREEEERQRREEEERQRREEEERQRREEEERQRREEEERLRREEEERRRQQEAEARRKHEEAERKKREAEAAARRAEEERRKRELDSVELIRYSAEELPGGCANAVEKYLFRVHEERQRPAAAVAEMRAAVNEARVNAPANVAKLEKRLAQAQDALLMYDVQTLRAYGGNVPKTCIAEGQAWFDNQGDVESENTHVQAYTHFYRLIVAHFVTMYRVAEGLAQYIVHAYTPALTSFTATASDYQNKAWAIYDELFPAKGSRPEMPIAELAKQLATMAGFAAVPIGLGIAAGIVSVIALPPVAAFVLVYEYLYKIWAELFIFYYIYGMKLPDGLVTAFKTTVENVKNSQWDVLGTRSADAFFGLVVDSDRIFYNGILAVFLLFHVVVIAFVLVCVWCRCCVPGMGRRKAKKSPLSAKTDNKSKNKSQSPKPAAPAKKKASPAPASAEKKKN